jgi:hypothetical protein
VSDCSLLFSFSVLCAVPFADGAKRPEIVFNTELQAMLMLGDAGAAAAPPKAGSGLRGAPSNAFGAVTPALGGSNKRAREAEANEGAVGDAAGAGEGEGAAGGEQERRRERKSSAPAPPPPECIDLTQDE